MSRVAHSKGTKRGNVGSSQRSEACLKGLRKSHADTAAYRRVLRERVFSRSFDAGFGFHCGYRKNIFGCGLRFRSTNLQSTPKRLAWPEAALSERLYRPLDGTRSRPSGTIRGAQRKGAGRGARFRRSPKQTPHSRGFETPPSFFGHHASVPNQRAHIDPSRIDRAAPLREPNHRANERAERHDDPLHGHVCAQQQCIGAKH